MGLEPSSRSLTVRLTALPGLTPKKVLKRPLIFPAVLGDFEHTEEANFGSYDTVGSGEYSTPAAGPSTARKLRTTDIEVLTLEGQPGFLTNPKIAPDDVRDQLYEILRSRRPFDFLATTESLGPKDEPSLSTELPMNATLRSITRSLRHGQPQARYYTLSFVEWRDDGVARKSAGGSYGIRIKLPTVHILRVGDTLSSLSKSFYGTYSGATRIANANGLRRWGHSTPLGLLPRFKAGSTIKIPTKAAVSSEATRGTNRGR